MSGKPTWCNVADMVCVVSGTWRRHVGMSVVLGGKNPRHDADISSEAETDKESEAKKDIVKLMLLRIRGDIQSRQHWYQISLQLFHQKGRMVLNQPCAAQASQFANLVQMTLKVAKHQDFTSIRSTQIPIQVMSKILASHMLQGNFATKKVTSLKLEAN
jgi:hypothetical protein